MARIRQPSRLVSCAIYRDGKYYTGMTYGEARETMGAGNFAKQHRPSDALGYMTNNNEFVTNDLAIKIGKASGQLPPDYEPFTVRYKWKAFPSADINWDGAPEHWDAGA